MSETVPDPAPGPAAHTTTTTPAANKPHVTSWPRPGDRRRAVADNTGIEWTDATWNPTTGCDKVSPGCDHCYAMTLAPRLKAMGSKRYQSDGDPRTSGPGFGITMHPDALDKPLRWTRPRRIFVNSMSDLFHDQVPDEFIARVFAVMALAPQHTFQVLTKRHGRMRSLLNSDAFLDLFGEALYATEHPAGEETAEPVSTWPLPNVWLGVSVENQQWADIRIPALLDTPAAVRFLSCEPLLGPVNLIGQGGNMVGAGVYSLPDPPEYDGGEPVCQDHGIDQCLRCTFVDWVIVGGESGRGARPMDLDWVRSLRDQCAAADVAFFYKQQGSGDGGPKSRRELDGRTWDQYPEAVTSRA